MIPSDIVLHQRSATLELTYSDASSVSLPAEYLRVYSPSAEVQGHSPDQAILQYGKKLVKIAAVEPQGNYAVRIVFSDGHDTGLYSWTYLHELGTQYEQKWRDYLDRLQAAGRTRDPVVIATSSD